MTADRMVASRVDRVVKEDFESFYPTIWPECHITRPFVPSSFDITEAFVDDDPSFNARHI
jgi:hypothetical protein